MMRLLLLTLFLLLVPCVSRAVEAPPGQARLGANDVLRGRFTEERQMKGFDAPMQTSGHFTVAPTHGLIWDIEKPFPTSTIITPNGMAQDLGGVALKLPVKNLRHLYDMIGGALAGDWNGLANDFTITRSGGAGHWQMLLTPRPDGQHSLSYTSITVTGGRFVENIAMIGTKNNSETMSFTDEALSSAPLGAREVAFFKEAGK
jgi:hypothetical protein